MTAKLRLTGRLVCASQAEVDAVHRYLPEHVRLTRAESGCLSFEVTKTHDPMVWRVEELFVDQAAFDAHQMRTKASAWAHKTAGIRRDYEVSIIVDGPGKA
ncbi:Antibiotic biosynthesis monooxygenase [Devosia equisanguinis]|uniref:Antibiotic biosynthesis monooxygenase n=1 Tax=Devosia equisanguinis TaxID=2490941 RepID=A0A447IEU5_9HYPH|nr:antibiotic biosynthesis monooxygenase [Devosia equisanguinis]VDS06003.1 Antibiotic biosynthesis monooxygenase [Devosia equisanguinis]